MLFICRRVFDYLLNQRGIAMKLFITLLFCLLLNVSTYARGISYRKNISGETLGLVTTTETGGGYIGFGRKVSAQEHTNYIRCDLFYKIVSEKDYTLKIGGTCVGIFPDIRIEGKDNLITEGGLFLELAPRLNERMELNLQFYPFYNTEHKEYWMVASGGITYFL